MKYIKFIQIFLLVFIIVGVGLLITQKIWVPKVVQMILKADTHKQQIPAISEDKNLPQVDSKNSLSPNNNQDSDKIKEVNIEMKGSSFSPRIVTIDNGTKLTWINNDSVPHKISSYKVRLYDAPSREIFSSPTILPGESYSFTFVNTKDLDRIFYRCEITPSIDGINPAMMGIIYIKDKEGRIWIND